MTGLSRAQVTRLLHQHRTTGAIADRRRPRHPFPRRYTKADIGLLAEVDALHGTLSGPATRKLCVRALRTCSATAASSASPPSPTDTSTTCATRPAINAAAGRCPRRPAPCTSPSASGAGPSPSDNPATCGSIPSTKETITAERRGDLPPRVGRSSGHVFRGGTSPPGGSLWSGARRGTRRAPGPKVGIGVGLGRAARTPPGPWWAAIAFAKSPAHATPCAPRGAIAHRLVAAVDADSNRLRPARHPESGGPPRPESVVDGRDAPSRPGRKAHNCHLSRGTDGVSPVRAVAKRRMRAAH